MRVAKEARGFEHLPEWDADASSRPFGLIALASNIVQKRLPPGWNLLGALG
jgi:hypothetical protein